MKKWILLSVTILGSYVSVRAADWVTDGGDTQRTGWARDEKIINKDNVKGMKLLWKIQTGNQVRALHALMPVVVVDNLQTSGGPKEIAVATGISDNLYGIDVKAGKIIWQKHYTYTPPAGRGGGGGGAASSDPAQLGFLGPGGSSDTPVIGPPDGTGRRIMYFFTGDGMLHQVNVADGEDMKPPAQFVPAGTKGWSLQLYKGKIWAPGLTGMMAFELATNQVYKTVGLGRSGGLWGRRGAAFDSEGIAWSTTGDGQYDPSDPNNLILANSVVGFQLEGDHIKVKDWFTPPNWDWLRKRDLDPNNTPAVFTWKGKEYLAASGKECRVYLLDPKNPGGADHLTPMFKTPLFCNEEVDFQDMGSWGAMSTWEESNGTRWILAPFWGPVHSQYKAPIMNIPTPKEGGVAAWKVAEKNGKLELEPAWVSRDMFRGEPPIIANGVVFSYGSGENTKQAFPDIGLNFTSTIRASLSGHATIYALDARTGKELWSSGDQITSFSHFSGISVANGRIYLGTYDGNLYCFGVQ